MTEGSALPSDRTIAVIVATYNNPQGLRHCLAGLCAQTLSDFEVVIADDGSDDRTREVLREPAWGQLRIRHVWQADRGYRVRMARNRAISQTPASFLLFLDGDCIPRDDWVARHVKYCPRGCFLAGARLDIPPSVHSHFQEADVRSQRVFDTGFLTRWEPGLNRYRLRLARNTIWESIADLATWRWCVFVSSNGSAWRDDILAVNGFDEAFPGYGSDDRDLGVRLRNSGVRPRYRKFSLVVLHLDHGKPYDDPEVRARNRAAFKRRIHDGTTRIEQGIDTVMLRD
ncbi:MAG TPA: glycosyltransferase [Pirellulaceae bacterium]